MTSDSNDNPIDLSRRCSSVETRKTPSPYNSSSFTETSPSLENDYPMLNQRKKMIKRSETPTNRYPTAEFLQREYSTASEVSSEYSYATKLTSAKYSPPSSSHQLHEQTINSNEDEINPYIMHALQKKLQGNSASGSAPSSPDSASSSSPPLMMGHDAKLTRPFKAYPQNPLSNPYVSILSSTSTLNDRISLENFLVYREQARKKIYAANGGHATITNPKMRRTSAKIFNECQPKIEIEHESELSNQTTNCPSDSSDGKKPLKDNAYFERRRKNNAAAKKSRDRRREKEDEIANRALLLERENYQLKIELAAVERQLAQFLPQQKLRKIFD